MKYLVNFYKMSELLFSGKLDIYMYSILEDVFVVLMLYSFLKLILLSSLVELIWPTQFFNRRNSMGVTSFRLRTYTEVLLKLRSSNINFSSLAVLLNFR
jgi:Tfp pilus assembly protein PilZ